MKVIAVVEQEDVSYCVLSHLSLLSREDHSRSPPADLPRLTALRDFVHVPVYDDLPFPEAAHYSPQISPLA